MIRLLPCVIGASALLFSALAPGADAPQFSVWKSSALNVRFTYGDRWTQSTPIQDSTQVAIVWLATRSGGLIATCHVQSAYSLGHLSPAQVHEKRKEISRAILAGTQKRDPEAAVIRVEALTQDNHPVVYIESEATVKDIESSSKISMYTIATAWRGKGVIFECAHFIPARWGNIRAPVEAEIMRVLRTLQFDR